MIGFYNYTTFLTYLSLISAGFGIVSSLSGTGHPYVGMFFLLFCGLCDAFDGKVARTKKDRSDTECKFGIQIDSLSDIVAFGVLPVCIAVGLLKADILTAFKVNSSLGRILLTLSVIIMSCYLLAGMIRLAYFNVMEEERQKTEEGSRKYYTGLPITSAAVTFPFVLAVNFVLKKLADIDLTFLYFLFMSISAAAFVAKVQLRKPGLKFILVLVGIGVVEAVVTLLVYQLP